ncbi:MAG: hypothetical protein PW843_05855 [Azospirillaceae bacterium]|nr:hypothetical protein [Azospirillaceae bacterium]
MALDPWQTVFQCSMLSNTAGMKYYTQPKSNPSALQDAETAMLADINAAIAAGIPSGWTVAWGPAVYCVGSIPWKDKDGTLYFTPTNAVVIFSTTDSAGATTYVVALAATNGLSVVDWLKEDFNVGTMVDWATAMKGWGANYTATTAAHISTATNTGITNVLTQLQSGGQNIIQFLNSVTTTNNTLIFTGHSLAGALSPTLTAACFDAVAPLVTNKNFAVGSTMVYPTAGATPGDGAFSQQFAALGLGGEDGSEYWQKWNKDLWNVLDVVPHAWQTVVKVGELVIHQPQSPYVQEIEATYTASNAYTSTADKVAITALIGTAALNSINGSISGKSWYTALPNAPLTNAFYYGYPGDGGVTNVVTQAQAQALGYTGTGTLVPWDMQFLYQHVQAYGQMILGNAPPIVVQPKKLKTAEEPAAADLALV